MLVESGDGPTAPDNRGTRINANFAKSVTGFFVKICKDSQNRKERNKLDIRVTDLLGLSSRDSGL